MVPDNTTKQYVTKQETNKSRGRKLSPLKKPRTVSKEQYDRATGCYIGSAYDEMGLSPAARCLYFHLVRRANGGKEREVELWREGKLRRTVPEGMRSISVYTGLSVSTIKRVTGELEKVKLIAVDRGYRGSQERETNTYTLRPPKDWCYWITVVRPGARKDPTAEEIPF